MAGKAWMLNEDDGAPEYHAAELRRLLSPTMSGADTSGRLAMRPGVRPHGDPVVELSGTTWIVHPHAGVLPSSGSSADGSYLYEEEGDSGPIDPADGANPRRDIVVERVYDDDIDSSGDREVVPEYLAGTPGSSPSAPVTPDGAIRLATIDVPASGMGSPTLTYDAPFTVAAGGVLPVREVADLPTVGVFAGERAWVQETARGYVRVGSVWVPERPAARRHRTSTQNVANASNTNVGFQSGGDWHVDDGPPYWTFTSSGSGPLTVHGDLYPGWYQVTAGLHWANASGGVRCLWVYANPAGGSEVQVAGDIRTGANVSGATQTAAVGPLFLDAETVFRVEARQTTGDTITLLGEPGTFLAVARL